MAKEVDVTNVKPGEQSILQVLVDSGSEELTNPNATSWGTKVRTMRKDPTIALARALVTAPVLAARWSYEETANAPTGAREFIESEMNQVRLHLLRNIMTGWLDFGWSPFEKVFIVNDEGMMTVQKLKPLLQDQTLIIVDPANGGFMGFKQEDDYLDLPYCFLSSCDVEGTMWYGQAIMRNAEGPYDSWSSLDTVATRYDTKVAGSHWVVYYPVGESELDGTMTDNYEIAKAILQGLEASGRVAIPRLIDQMLADSVNVAGNVKDGGWRIELISDQGAGSTSFIDRMKYVDNLKVRALGLPERSVLEGQYGTKADAESHADFAITNMELRHEMMVLDINWHLVNQLLLLNYGPGTENSVYIKPAPIADKTLSFLREIYRTMIQSPEGFAHEILGIDTGALKDKLGIPVDEFAEDEELQDTGSDSATSGEDTESDPVSNPDTNPDAGEA